MVHGWDCGGLFDDVTGQRARPTRADCTLTLSQQYVAYFALYSTLQLSALLFPELVGHWKETAVTNSAISSWTGKAAEQLRSDDAKVVAFVGAARTQHLRFLTSFVEGLNSPELLTLAMRDIAEEYFIPPAPQPGMLTTFTSQVERAAAESRLGVIVDACLGEGLKRSFAAYVAVKGVSEAARCEQLVPCIRKYPRPLATATQRSIWTDLVMRMRDGCSQQLQLLAQLPALIEFYYVLNVSCSQHFSRTDISGSSTSNAPLQFRQLSARLPAHLRTAQMNEAVDRGIRAWNEVHKITGGRLAIACEEVVTVIEAIADETVVFPFLTSEEPQSRLVNDGDLLDVIKFVLKQLAALRDHFTHFLRSCEGGVAPSALLVGQAFHIEDMATLSKAVLWVIPYRYGVLSDTFASRLMSTIHAGLSIDATDAVGGVLLAHYGACLRLAQIGEQDVRRVFRYKLDAEDDGDDVDDADDAAGSQDGRPRHGNDSSSRLHVALSRLRSHHPAASAAAHSGVPVSVLDQLEALTLAQLLDLLCACQAVGRDILCRAEDHAAVVHEPLVDVIEPGRHATLDGLRDALAKWALPCADVARLIDAVQATADTRDGNGFFDEMQQKFQCAALSTRLDATVRGAVDSVLEKALDESRDLQHFVSIVDDDVKTLLHIADAGRAAISLEEPIASHVASLGMAGDGSLLELLPREVMMMHSVETCAMLKLLRGRANLAWRSNQTAADEYVEAAVPVTSPTSSSCDIHRAAGGGDDAPPTAEFDATSSTFSDEETLEDTTTDVASESHLPTADEDDAAGYPVDSEEAAERPEPPNIDQAAHLSFQPQGGARFRYRAISQAVGAASGENDGYTYLMRHQQVLHRQSHSRPWITFMPRSVQEFLASAPPSSRHKAAVDAGPRADNAVVVFDCRRKDQITERARLPIGGAKMPRAELDARVLGIISDARDIQTGDVIIKLVSRDGVELPDKKVGMRDCRDVFVVNKVRRVPGKPEEHLIVERLVLQSSFGNDHAAPIAAVAEAPVAHVCNHLTVLLRGLKRLSDSQMLAIETAGGLLVAPETTWAALPSHAPPPRFAIIDTSPGTSPFVVCTVAQRSAPGPEDSGVEPTTATGAAPSRKFLFSGAATARGVLAALPGMEEYECRKEDGRLSDLFTTSATVVSRFLAMKGRRIQIRVAPLPAPLAIGEHDTLLDVLHAVNVAVEGSNRRGFFECFTIVPDVAREGATTAVSSTTIWREDVEYTLCELRMEDIDHHVRLVPLPVRLASSEGQMRGGFASSTVGDLLSYVHRHHAPPPEAQGWFAVDEATLRLLPDDYPLGASDKREAVEASSSRESLRGLARRDSAVVVRALAGCDTRPVQIRFEDGRTAPLAFHQDASPRQIMAALLTHTDENMSEPIQPDQEPGLVWGGAVIVTTGALSRRLRLAYLAENKHLLVASACSRIARHCDDAVIPAFGPIDDGGRRGGAAHSVFEDDDDDDDNERPEQQTRKAAVQGTDDSKSGPSGQQPAAAASIFDDDDDDDRDDDGENVASVVLEVPAAHAQANGAEEGVTRPPTMPSGYFASVISPPTRAVEFDFVADVAASTRTTTLRLDRSWQHIDATHLRMAFRRKTADGDDPRDAANKGSAALQLFLPRGDIHASSSETPDGDEGGDWGDDVITIRTVQSAAEMSAPSLDVIKALYSCTRALVPELQPCFTVALAQDDSGDLCV